MSAAAVGADLLYRMEMEELVELYTRDRFVSEFANLIAASTLTDEQITKLWRKRRTMLEQEARKRYDKRVASWVPPAGMLSDSDLAPLFAGRSPRRQRSIA